MMRAVVQRVKSARVMVEGRRVSEIGRGLVVFLGVARDDTAHDADYLANKIANLRVFEDDVGRMNHSLLEVSGETLVVSQFTLYGDSRRGRRPSFNAAARSDKGEALYEEFLERMYKMGISIKTGVFQAMMDIELVNHGPVTMLLDSTKLF